MPIIKGRRMSLPVIQGGMGIGVSLGGLAGSVAACGGMGVISSANRSEERRVGKECRL